MTNPIAAIYENGVLRPLTPLELPEHTTVQIYVQPAASADSEEHRRQVHAALVAAGLSQPNAAVVQALLDTGQVGHLDTANTEDDASATEHQPPPVLIGTPVSDIIIAERRGEL